MFRPSDVEQEYRNEREGHHCEANAEHISEAQSINAWIVARRSPPDEAGKGRKTRERDGDLRDCEECVDGVDDASLPPPNYNSCALVEDNSSIRR